MNTKMNEHGDSKRALPEISPAQQAGGSDAGVSLQHARLSIGGMRCAACTQLIEFRLRQLTGIDAFQINPATHCASIAFNPGLVSQRDIVAAISALGYSALPLGSDGSVIDRESKMSLWRLFVAGFAMMQVMMYAFPAYLEPFPSVDGDLTPDIDRLLKLASLALTIPVVVFSAGPFFRAAWRDLGNRHIGMDVPVAVGVAVTFGASVWASFAGGPVYFDSLIMFVFLLLGAREIEARVHRKSTAALRALTALTPLQADRLPDYPESHEVQRIAAAELRAGDVISIPAGAQIAADGVVIAGTGQCDETWMTGESQAVGKNVGDKLIGGALNLCGHFLLRVERAGDDTELSALVRMMESAAAGKPALVLLADRYASLFLSSVMLLALLSGIVWWQIDASRAVWIAVTVLVITCPCALSLATPGVMSGALGQLARRGVLVARGKAVESLAGASHFIFDKTGTLTHGRLKLVHTHILRSGAASSPQEIRALAATMAAASSHPVSQALAAAGPTSAELAKRLDSCSEIAGQGVQAQDAERSYRLGSIGFVQELTRQPLAIPPGFAGHTLAALGDSDGWIALFALQDTVREDAPALIEFLRQKGKAVLLMSGDRSDVVDGVARSLGIADAWGELTPARKHDLVRQLQQQGAVVAMVGDGMNDGPVLSLANASVAMGQGAPVSQACSDLVLVSNRLADLQQAVNISIISMKLIRQNLAWAVLYNLIAIPAAVAGVLAPWHAAIGMSLSSLIVVMNSLRVFRVSPESRPGAVGMKNEVNSPAGNAGVGLAGNTATG